MGDQERRRLLRLGLVAAGAAALAACAPPPPPNRPTEVPTPTVPAAEVVPPFEEWKPPTDKEREEAFNARHHVAPATPNIWLPFKTGTIYKVDEGDIYGKEEYDIHKDRPHKGIDWSCEIGTEVRAPRDGYAASSYQLVWNRDLRPGSPKPAPYILYEGRLVGIGLGLFVVMYGPDNNRFDFLGHLADCLIPLTAPNSGQTIGQTQYEYNPTVQALTAEQRDPKNLDNNPNWVKVKKGDLLGHVGTSGLLLVKNPNEFFEYRPGMKAINTGGPTWDEPHLHFEEFGRDEKGAKYQLRDPYGIYGIAKDYPYPGNDSEAVKKNVREPLMVMGADGLPAFAA